MTPRTAPPVSSPAAMGALGLARARLDGATGTVSALQSVWGMARAARDWHQRRTTWSVTIRSDNPLYPDVHAWLLTLVPAREQRAVVAHAVNVHHGGYPFDPDEGHTDDRRPPGMVFTQDEAAEKVIIVEGHRVRFVVDRGEEDSPMRSGGVSLRRESVRFSTTSPEGQYAVRRKLEEFADARRRTKQAAVVKLYATWGDWTRRTDLPLRPLSSVVLADGQAERISSDLARFLAAEARYIHLGLPYHRCYLFEGPPGTGKTSLAKALAREHGLDLWYLNLSSLDSDTALTQAVSSVRGGILLVEDIDSVAAARTRVGTKGEVTIAGLLNTLDGVVTPHGLITIITTNAPEVIEEALLRPGRVDVVEHMGYPDTGHAGRLFEAFYGAPPAAPLDLGGRVSPAAMYEVCKRHMDDPVAGEAAIRAATMADQVTASA